MTTEDALQLTMSSPGSESVCVSMTHEPRDLRRDLIAAVPIFLAGSALHFSYAWLGESAPAALFAAVNESVWEHLKIAFWPALLWAAVQSRLARSAGSGYWAARGYGLCAISLSIIVLFYGYTAILGENLLAADISIFAVAIFIGQAVANRMQTATRRATALRKLGIALLLAQIGAFATFTYMPPKAFLFEDPRNGQYGLMREHSP